MITLMNLASKHIKTISLTCKIFFLVVALLLALTAFTVVIDAVFEVCHHIAEVYAASDSITRLFTWIVGAIFLYKLGPFLARLLERWF